MSRLGVAAVLLLVCGTVFALIIPDHTMELQWNANEILKFWLGLLGTWMLCYAILERIRGTVPASARPARPSCRR